MILSKFILHIIGKNSIIFSVNKSMYNFYLIYVVDEKSNEVKFKIHYPAQVNLMLCNESLHNRLVLKWVSSVITND